MNPMILYDNRFLDGIPMATDTSEGFSALNVVDLKTFTFWQAGEPGYEDIAVDCGAAKSADALGIIGHNLGTVQADISVESSDDGDTWTQALEPFTPTGRRRHPESVPLRRRAVLARGDRPGDRCSSVHRRARAGVQAYVPRADGRAVQADRRGDGIRQQAQQSGPPAGALRQIQAVFDLSRDSRTSTGTGWNRCSFRSGSITQATSIRSSGDGIWNPTRTTSGSSDSSRSTRTNRK